MLGLVGFAPVIVDGLLGGHLIRQSFLGYDPIIGARYYGIGNEYMGVVIGAVLLMVAAWLEWKRPTGRWVKIGTAFLFVFLVLYFAAPFWGTNAGGALAASAGFGVGVCPLFSLADGLAFLARFCRVGRSGCQSVVHHECGVRRIGPVSHRTGVRTLAERRYRTNRRHRFPQIGDERSVDQRFAVGAGVFCFPFGHGRAHYSTPSRDTLAEDALSLHVPRFYRYSRLGPQRARLQRFRHCLRSDGYRLRRHPAVVDRLSGVDAPLRKVLILSQFAPAVQFLVQLPPQLFQLPLQAGRFSVIHVNVRLSEALFSFGHIVF